MATYTYYRPKTAATMDFYAEWKDIVRRHELAEAKDMDALLKTCVNYLKSVGYDLDLSKSYLAKEYHGSDGARIVGSLWLTERPENNVKAEKASQVEMWVNEALQMHGSARNRGPYTWEVDISGS